MRGGVACELQSGDVGVERYEGFYEARGSRMSIVLIASTCRGAVEPVDVDYELRNERLFLDLPGGRLIFERVESDGTGNGILRNGCWDGDTLVFGELRPL